MNDRTETTTRPTPTIKCPDWCQEPLQRHLNELDGWEGRVVHRADRWGQEAAPYAGEGWEVSLSSCTFPDGQEADNPAMVAVTAPGDYISVADARALAQAILVACQDAESGPGLHLVPRS